MLIVPASRNSRTTLSSYGGTKSGIVAEPNRVGTPATWLRSLIAIGTPSSGGSSRASRVMTSCSARFALARAASSVTVTNAPTSGSMRANRSSAASTSSTGLTVRWRTSVAHSSALSSCNAAMQGSNGGRDDGVDARRFPTEVTLPGGVALCPSHDDSHRRRWLRWWNRKAPAELGEQPVALAMVASGARRHHVGPAVLPTARARPDVIDRVGLDAAVRARMRVAVEHRATGERHFAAVRHPYVVRQAYHGGYLDGGALGAHQAVAGLDDDCLLSEHQDDRAAHRHDAQRFVRRV